jgi:hypothetical protein
MKSNCLHIKSFLEADSEKELGGSSFRLSAFLFIAQAAIKMGC